jgi:predicted HicB family RNase H-like nuclease
LNIGRVLKRGIDDWSNKIAKRKSLMNENLIKYAANVRETLQESRRRFERKLNFGVDMKDMIGSLNDIKDEIRLNDLYQEGLLKWVQEKVKRTRK